MANSLVENYLCDNLNLDLGKSEELVAAVINEKCTEDSREYIYYACSGARLPVHAVEKHLQT